MQIVKTEHIEIDGDYGIQLDIRREDLIHPHISGNKFRKLKYNLIEAREQGCKTLLTFGGAYSNHIAATAYAGKLYGVRTIGIIRGEELAARINENPTLKFAQSMGMHLDFVSRDVYRQKHQQEFLEGFKNKYEHLYILPEGGTNELAIKGCEEILTEVDKKYNFICSSVGTGGTLAGLIRASFSDQYVMGFSALKGQGLKEDISKFANHSNWDVNYDYHFGGYAKINDDLVSFINWFKTRYNIPLDPVYTGKMMYGIMNLIEAKYFPKGSKILAIHTGGLQGIKGMNKRLSRLQKPLINE
ncbi:1-aminocyclopropane-1-carboxylate deaminase/D-cysteine desulfhydrase [Winogradskyella aurantiaca]|uniref:1-aminocyclopropane-1-carboxylate deaminase/D-cysteine desulfhydrase n=1 Tax=Winogradskyella aurantiaca TaxID=2219558 RepID=UPI000E1C57DB|nr:pyridoxal-phosphate dependent enzyme [Winogradskyella aurantiaca]